jgi:uncharacterized protein (TIGR02996 family)
VSGDELLAAVIADPDDVDRRLVYADWLMAQGDPQGELIQLCERRRSHPDPSLDARIEELEAAYRERIAGELAQRVNFRIDCGLVTKIGTSPQIFAEHGERLLASHPLTQQLDIFFVSDAKPLAQLARVPALRGLRILHVSQNLGIDRRGPRMPFDELLASPYFEALQCFEVDSWKTEGNPHEAFAGWHAPRLQELSLFEVDEAPQILTGLARNQSIRLRELGITSRFPEGPSWLPALAAPAFERLETLYVTTGGLSTVTLLRDVELPLLTILAVEGCFPLGELCFPSLRKLRGGSITAPEFVELLERHPRLTALWINEMPAHDVNRALEHALALPSDHPLVCLELPWNDYRVDRRLLRRASRRFPREWHSRR